MKRMSRKEKRRLQKARNAGLIMTIFFSLLMTFFLFYSSFYNIVNIETVGNEKTSASLLINISKIRFGENIFRADTKGAEKEVLKLPYIKSVNITRQNRNTVRISVKEREEIFSVLSNGLVYICDENGRILAKSNISSVYPIVKGVDLKDYEPGQNIFEENEELNDLKTIIDTAYELKLLDYYLEIRIQDDKEFGLTRAGDIRVDFGTAERAKNKFNFIERTLESLNAKNKETSLIKLNTDPPVTFLKDEQNAEE